MCFLQCPINLFFLFFLEKQNFLLQVLTWRKQCGYLPRTSWKWPENKTNREELDKFKCLEAKCREKPWKVRARTYGTKSPSRSEALRFIDSAKSFYLFYLNLSSSSHVLWCAPARLTTLVARSKNGVIWICYMLWSSNFQGISRNYYSF